MLALVLPIVALQAGAAATDETIEAVPLPEVRVYSRRLDERRTPPASVTGLAEDVLRDVGATHPAELFQRVPGTWISRGSGQEHLTAIRSPVLTGPGACGAFLYLEDRVPIRPAGFCNVNELFEVNLLQAERVDVLRGPGNVVHGSNALHGAIDASTRGPLGVPGASGGLEAGTDDYFRGRFALSSTNTIVYGNYTDAGSFREDEGYRQAFLNFVDERSLGGAEVRTALAWAELDQDTAGFILGKDAYEDEVLRLENLNPEAFRKADAWRLTSRWRWTRASGTWEAIPFARSSDMDFLQHFLPGKPLEQNGQDSLGVLLSWRGDSAWSAGVDMEWARGELYEFQDEPITGGSAFLRETRPQGAHYDYEVSSWNLGAWARYAADLGADWRLEAGLRFDVLDYDYDNRMHDGNTRDDGTVCGFGGCLYERPADRSDRFENWAPELTLTRALDADTDAWFRLTRGFRAPQATELYRLQRGQSVADLDSETLDAVEIGLRGRGERLSWEVAGYAMRKRHFIFRDADGFNVSDGRTTHAGAEALVAWRIADTLELGGNLAYGRHRYDFDRLAGGGEVIVAGNEVDTAPRWTGAARLAWRPTLPVDAELEWIHMGSYQLDAANEHEYGGHDLLNLWARFEPAARVSSGRLAWSLALRVTNLLDERYAERADFAFGNYRYFPGAGRRFVIELGFAY